MSKFFCYRPRGQCLSHYSIGSIGWLTVSNNPRCQGIKITDQDWDIIVALAGFNPNIPHGYTPRDYDKINIILAKMFDL